MVGDILWLTYVFLWIYVLDSLVDLPFTGAENKVGNERGSKHLSQ